MNLENKNILIGVSSSIAIYKTLELIRLFIKAKANVRVILTPNSEKFITKLTFEAISKNIVLCEESESWASDNNHIDIGKWADTFIIAPASANTINKLSNGICDNLLLQSALAYKGKILLAPAMNTNMLKHPITDGSLKLLGINNYKIIKPSSKLLACGDVGEGALADVNDIFFEGAKEVLKDDFWEYRRVIVTGGGTIEKIDDVRFISNFSSGKMALSLAKALYLKGADVCFIKTKELDVPSGIYSIDVENSNEMRDFLADSINIAKKGTLVKPTLGDDFEKTKLIQKTPYLFMASAVSDYVPKYPQKGKLKKELLGDEFSLELKKNIDILESINKDGIKAVGFKAEFDRESAKSNAENMLKKKNLDAVCLNILDKNGFGSDTNEIDFITNRGSVNLEMDSKDSIAFDILKNAEALDV